MDLSTSLFIMGKEKAIEFWKAHSDEFDTIMLTKDGTLYVTEGIGDDFSTELNDGNCQAIKVKEEGNVMDIKDKGKKIKSFAPALSVALVTACVARFFKRL